MMYIWIIIVGVIALGIILYKGKKKKESFQEGKSFRNIRQTEGKWRNIHRRI